MGEREPFGVTAALLEPAAFRAFYDRALPVVYGYFFKRCGGNMELATELTQETFASAVRALRHGAQVEAPLPWIVTIARRRLVDHYRRARRFTESTNHLRLEVIEVGPAFTSASEVRLWAALAELPANHRLVLLLRYVDDLAVAEVAHELGKGVRATESLISRARSALTRAYEERDHA
jgi:RNA polymerase sigma-70 factor, ECF subfamily